jgi:hypothetical protein
MEAHVAIPLALLMASLLLAGAGWAVRRPALPAAGSLTLLAATGVLASGLLDEGPVDRSAATAVVVVGGLLAVAGGGPLTTAVFQLVDGSHESEASSVRAAGEVLRGGTWIGALERGAVYAALVAGWPEGVALVLGLKGLGRYPELRNQEHTGTAERFIIGTFTSVLWAAACAGVVHVVR